jgi:DNA repair exonuclease SbcCD ATPase subunit
MEENKFDPLQFIGFLLISGILMFWFYDNQSNMIDSQKEIVDESQGDSRKTQDAINELLGMSHDMFKHVVALNTYTEPFLNMRQNDQRMIIEQLLGITLLSEKAERLKEQVRSTKEAISEEEARIRAVQTSNEHIQESIDSLKLKQSAWKAQKEKGIGKLQRSITELEELDIENELELHSKTCRLE